MPNIQLVLSVLDTDDVGDYAVLVFLDHEFGTLTTRPFAAVSVMSHVPALLLQNRVKSRDAIFRLRNRVKERLSRGGSALTDPLQNRVIWR